MSLTHPDLLGAGKAIGNVGWTGSKVRAFADRKAGRRAGRC